MEASLDRRDIPPDLPCVPRQGVYFLHRRQKPKEKKGWRTACDIADSAAQRFLSYLDDMFDA